jgi:hypothetical protein
MGKTQSLPTKIGGDPIPIRTPAQLIDSIKSFNIGLGRFTNEYHYWGVEFVFVDFNINGTMYRMAYFDSSSAYYYILAEKAHFDTDKLTIRKGMKDKHIYLADKMVDITGYIYEKLEVEGAKFYPPLSRSVTLRSHNDYGPDFKSEGEPVELSLMFPQEVFYMAYDVAFILGTHLPLYGSMTDGCCFRCQEKTCKACEMLGIETTEEPDSP